MGDHPHARITPRGIIKSGGKLSRIAFWEVYLWTGLRAWIFRQRMGKRRLFSGQRRTCGKNQRELNWLSSAPVTKSKG